jgi:hypothetical protein
MAWWLPIATALDSSEEWGTFVAALNDHMLGEHAPSICGIRQGQAFMNALWIVRPDLYEVLTASIHDPFYRDDNLPEAINILYQHFVLTLP